MDIMEARFRNGWAVDVRDMLCAQALTVVAQAAARLQPGQALEVIYDAEDVKRDLLVWAKDRGHPVEEPAQATLRIAQSGRAGGRTPVPRAANPPPRP